MRNKTLSHGQCNSKYKPSAGWEHRGGKFGPLSLGGQKKDPQEDNCLIDTDRSNISKDTQVKYEVFFELQANSNWSVKGKASMTRYKAWDTEWEEIPHRINKCKLIY